MKPKLGNAKQRLYTAADSRQEAEKIILVMVVLAGIGSVALVVRIFYLLTSP